jgi:hypothetical protein
MVKELNVNVNEWVYKQNMWATSAFEREEECGWRS